jgi:hypothetical protein
VKRHDFSSLLLLLLPGSSNRYCHRLRLDFFFPNRPAIDALHKHFPLARIPSCFFASRGLISALCCDPAKDASICGIAIFRRDEETESAGVDKSVDDELDDDEVGSRPDHKIQQSRFPTDGAN